jgi:uncharacterized SAM-binding protein YcdF (DUF218 family)
VSGWRIAFLLALAAVLGLLALGFVQFAREVYALRPPKPVPRVDAIVSLTGGSLQRLRTGVQLLEAGRGARLLISGVYPRATDADIAKAVQIDPDLLACCVDLGRQASDTIGNAAETAQWVQTHGYRRILLVTEDYHMPRSLLELRLAMPEVEVIAFPVASRLTEPSLWRNDPKIAGRLALEYGKLLVIQARELVLQSGGSAPSAAPASEG